MRLPPRLRRRRRYRETFGVTSTPYRSSYAVDPDSRRYVLNLDQWYAQSHPVEDFAETFAVWLKPGNKWKKAYDGWPVMRKLEYALDQRGWRALAVHEHGRGQLVERVGDVERKRIVTTRMFADFRSVDPDSRSPIDGPKM